MRIATALPDIRPRDFVRQGPGIARDPYRVCSNGHDYVVVPLLNGKLKIDDGKDEHIVDLKAGGSYARPVGVEHNVINANDFEYAFVEIEIKP